MRTDHRAFTLVEMLVAVGITAVLAALLLAMVTQTLGVWERSASALSMENRAGRVLERMATDWESAFARRDGREWIEVSTASEWRLFAQVAATSGDPTDPNTLREVNYRLIDNRLYRWEGTAAEALRNDYTWSVPEEIAAEFLLADHVLELTLTGYREDDTEIEPMSPEDWPTRVRVELTLISEDGAQRLAAVSDGVSDEPADQIRAQTTRRYVRWVGIQGRAW